jgi:hypothetical protein
MTADGVLRYGRVTEGGIVNPFAAGRIDIFSAVTTPLQIYARDELLGHATGFFWRAGDECYLITSWHVVSGNNPFTRMSLSNGRPSRLVAYDFQWLDSPAGNISVSRTPRQIELFNSDDPTWFQHGKFDQYRTDVVALPISGWDVARPQSRPVCVNDHTYEQLPHFAGSELYVLGYPLASFDGAMLPLWKRGSFASDPQIPVDDRPVFLIDVDSSKGMSGSPVFRRVFGPVPTADLSTMRVDAIVTNQFAGVYAGRLGTAELDRVGLGYAWYGSVVDEIVSAKVRGSTA